MTLQNVTSKYKSKKFVLVVVDECHEVYTKSQQKPSENNKEKIIDVVRNICNDSLLRIFMSRDNHYEWILRRVLARGPYGI